MAAEPSRPGVEAKSTRLPEPFGDIGGSPGRVEVVGSLPALPVDNSECITHSRGTMREDAPENWALLQGEVRRGIFFGA